MQIGLTRQIVSVSVGAVLFFSTVLSAVQAPCLIASLGSDAAAAGGRDIHAAHTHHDTSGDVSQSMPDHRRDSEGPTCDDCPTVVFVCCDKVLAREASAVTVKTDRLFPVIVDAPAWAHMPAPGDPPPLLVRRALATAPPLSLLQSPSVTGVFLI